MTNAMDERPLTLAEAGEPSARRRRRARFTQADVIRLLKAAKAAGCPVDRFEMVDGFGNKVIAVMGDGDHTVRIPEGSEPNPWDEVLIHVADEKRSS
jgi:hypothetical protein